jgi:hypothetical protein
MDELLRLSAAAWVMLTTTTIAFLIDHYMFKVEVVGGSSIGRIGHWAVHYANGAMLVYLMTWVYKG